MILTSFFVVVAFHDILSLVQDQGGGGEDICIVITQICVGGLVLGF